MKAKLAILTLVGLVTCHLALAQTNTAEGLPATATTPPPAVSGDAQPATEAAAPVPAVTGEAQPTDAATPAPAPAEGQPASPATTPAATAEGQPANTAAAPVAAADAQPVATETAPGAVIPLIQFQDVPITTAIENLARQAGINYILDPNVGYGQPDDKGTVRAQPNISIRWENLTAQQALNALLNNYGLQMVEDNKTKIARVTKKDPAAPDPLVTRIVQLKFASPSNILTSVQSVLTDKRSKVVADVRTSQLVVSATEKEHESVDSLVARLDTQTKQVLIEAKLLETSKNPRTLKGIDWSDTLTAQRITMGNNALPGTPPSPASTVVTANGVVTTPADPGTIGGVLSDPKLLAQTSGRFFNPATAFLNADGLSVVMSFINNDVDSQVLSEPRAVTLDNQEAMLSVARVHPIFKNTAGTQGSPGGSEVTYTNLGTTLKVTPRISANDFINLKVEPTVSSQGGVARKTVAGTVNEADIYDIRTIKTEVMIPSGNTLVLGGLISDDRRNGYSKVPILGDIPVLGWAFRHENKTQLKKNLIIFITPSVVRDSDYQPTESTYLQTKSEVIADPKLSVWDSAKPHDWSNPSEDNGSAEYRDPGK